MAEEKEKAEKSTQPIQHAHGEQAQSKKEIEDILSEPPKEDDLDIEEAVEDEAAINKKEEEPEEIKELEEEAEEATRAVSEEDTEEDAEDAQSELTEKAEPEPKEEPKPVQEKVKDKEKKGLFRRKDKKKEKKTEEKSKAVSSEVQTHTLEKGARSNKLKTALIIILTILITAAAVLGGVYFYYKKYMQKPAEEPKQEEAKTEEPITEKEKVYVTAADGLNLRREPSVSSELLAIIPFGTELEVLEESGEWIKTNYNSKEGWVFASYTSKENPLVYQNTEYGFQLTFKQSWAGYKFFQRTMDGATAVFYLGLPTKQAGWKSTGVDTGYSGMFAIDVYTADQWATISAGEDPKPVKLGEKGNYVFAWSSAQSAPKDLEARFSEIKSIIDTFKII